MTTTPRPPRTREELDRSIVRRAHIGTPTERLLLGSLTFAMAEGRLAALGLFWNADRSDFVEVTG